MFYYLSKSADDAYHAELAREFGAAEAGDARYDRARNASTPVLALLLAATRACNDARWVASTELAHTAGQYAARDSAAADAAYRLACSGGDSLADVLALAAPARA